MKKIALISSVFLFFALAIPVFAAKSGVGAQNTNSNQQVSSPSPTGNQIKNQNRVTTQNEGEDTQLQVSTQEQEENEQGSGEGLQTRSQNAIENMSEVAKQVQALLQVRTIGGIGEQVREIARAQNQAQAQIQEQLNRLESRGRLTRFLLGTDLKTLKNLKAELAQNQLRIKQLEQLQNKLSNQADITMVQEAIQSLIQENTALQETINTEEAQGSLFGWLIKFFAK